MAWVEISTRKLLCSCLSPCRVCLSSFSCLVSELCTAVSSQLSSSLSSSGPGPGKRSGSTSRSLSVRWTQEEFDSIFEMDKFHLKCKWGLQEDFKWDFATLNSFELVTNANHSLSFFGPTHI